MLEPQRVGGVAKRARAYMNYEPASKYSSSAHSDIGILMFECWPGISYQPPVGCKSTCTHLVVRSLVQQCQSYILMHMEEFPVSLLSLLPLSVRKELLWRMPMYWVLISSDLLVQISYTTSNLRPSRVRCFTKYLWLTNHNIHLNSHGPCSESEIQ